MTGILRWKWAGLLLLGCAWLGFAADSNTGNKPKDKQVVDTKATKRPSAGAVNFKKELGLPYPSLGTLGARIEAARRAPDPVALAHAASELAVAEKVSGKKASVTSAALLKESAEVAGLRKQVAELKATLEIAKQTKAADDLSDQIEKLVAQAKAFARKQSAEAAKNSPLGPPRKLIVDNGTTDYVDVYVNGFYKMRVDPGSRNWCIIEHKWMPTILKAYGDL